MGKNFYYNKNDKEVYELLRQAGVDTTGMTEEQMVNMVNVAKAGAQKIRRVINAPTVRAKLGSINGLFYYEKISDSEVREDYRKYMASFLQKDILWLYMLKTREYHVTDDFFEVSEEKWNDIDRKYIDNISGECSSMINRIRENYTEHSCVSWKLVSNNYICYFYIDKYIGSANIIDQETTDKLRTLDDIMIYRFDLRKKILTCSRYTVDPMHDEYHAPVINGSAATPLYIGKERDIENYINSIPKCNSVERVLGVLLSHKALQILCDKTDHMSNPDNGLNMYPVYQNFEMKMFNKFININSDEYKCLEVRYYGQDVNDVVPNKFYTNFSTDNVPKIDFTQKELNFSSNYTTKTSLFGGEKKVNFHEILTDQRWGKRFLLPIKNIIPDTTIDIILNYNYFEDIDIVDFTIGIPYKGYMAAISCVFKNIKKFEFTDSFLALRLYVSFNQLDSITLPSDVPGYEGLIPEKLLDEKFVMSMIADIIGIYVVLHDRPDRSKMIKETRRVVTKPQSKNKTRGKQKPEQEYVVRRILKPVKEAKEYIAQMSLEEHRDAEYTMESWPRKEHQRRKPGTENEFITIKATTCHRHKELSTKEVHLKL